MPKSLKRPSHERAALSWSSSLFLGSLLLGKSRRSSALQSAKRVQAACTNAVVAIKTKDQTKFGSERERGPRKPSKCNPTALKGKALSEALHYLDFGRPNARHRDLPEIQEFLIRRFQIMMRWRWSVLRLHLVPVVRFGPLFSRRSSVLGFHFGAGGAFWAPFWCWWSVLEFHFGAGGSFWGSILVPVLVLHFGAGGPFWDFTLKFGTWWSVLGLHFGASGSFWWFILVPVVRSGAPFWCLVVRFGAPFWCRWSVLGLRFDAGGPSVLGLRFGAWCRWFVLGLRFGAGGPF